MGMMNAIQIYNFGSDEVLEYTKISKPELTNPNTVLIKVSAIGLNPIDIKTRNGVGLLQQDSLPLILGWDVAGTIIATNGDTSGFNIGDEVCGMIAFPKPANAYAEYVVADVADLVKKPINCSLNEAAAFPLVTLTAWQALFEHAKLQKGETVLIHAGSGGVGHVAVQLANWCGAKVYTTAKADNHAWVTELGADHCIDYKTENFNDVLKDIDVVFDTIGGDNLFESLKVLKPNTGRLVTTDPHPYVSPDLLKQAEENNIKAEGILVHIDKQHLTKIAELIENNQLKIVLDKVFNFNNMQAAHQYLEQGHTKGKVVVEL